MPVFFHDLNVLSNSAKKLERKLKTHSIEISSNKSLNIISLCFGWESWNSVFFSNHSVAKPLGSLYWEDLRWWEKFSLVCGNISSALRLINETKSMGKELELEIRLWLRVELAPPRAGLPSNMYENPSFFSKLKKKNYADLKDEHLKEGIEFVASDTLLFINHLKEQFLDDMDNPGCIVFCEPINTIEFARMFKDKGYDISLISNNLSLPSEFKSFTRALTVNYGVLNIDLAPSILTEYIEGLKSHINNRANKAKASILLDLVYELFIFGLSKKNNQLFIPSLDELMDIHYGDYPDNIKKIIQKLFDEIDVKPSQRENAILPPSYSLYENTVSTIRGGIEILKTVMTSSSEAIPINRIGRPNRKCATLIPVTNDDAASSVHSSILTDLLMKSFSSSPSIYSSDDIFVFSSNKGTVAGPAFDINRKLKFLPHKMAKANICVYGEATDRDHDVNTQVFIEAKRWWALDFRLFRLV